MIDITRSGTDVYDSDLFTTLGMLPLSTTLTGYLLVCQTDYVVENITILPPGTDIVLSSANPFPGGQSLKVTVNSDDYFIIGDWNINNLSFRWTGETTFPLTTTVIKVFGLITPAGARKRRLMRRKLMLRTNQVL